MIKAFDGEGIVWVEPRLLSKGEIMDLMINTFAAKRVTPDPDLDTGYNSLFDHLSFITDEDTAAMFHADVSISFLLEEQ